MWWRGQVMLQDEHRRQRVRATKFALHPVQLSAPIPTTGPVLKPVIPRDKVDVSWSPRLAANIIHCVRIRPAIICTGRYI